MPYSFRHTICDANSILSDLLALFYLLISLAEELLSPSDFPAAANLGSSVSPYHEVMRMERRLRSSSEGAGGPRVHGNHRDAVGMEGCGLLKHRHNSSSSKMGSLVGALKSHCFLKCIFWLVYQGKYRKWQPLPKKKRKKRNVIMFGCAEKCIRLSQITGTRTAGAQMPLVCCLFNVRRGERQNSLWSKTWFEEI